MRLSLDAGDDCGSAFHVDAIKIRLGGTAHDPGGMDHRLTVATEAIQGNGVREVALDGLGAQFDKLRSLGDITDEKPDAVSALQQALAELAAYESGGAGDADQVAVDDQAEAALRRTSSAMPLRCSTSCSLIKSRRALARDSLPEEVRGREWMGTSST